MNCPNCLNIIKNHIECNLCKEKFCSEKCSLLHNKLYHQSNGEQSQEQSINNNSFLNYARETSISESSYLVKGVMNYDYIIYDQMFSLENFKLLFSNGIPKSIGSGSFGQVYLAINKINKKTYAIKHMEKEKLFNYLTCLDPIYAEIDIQSRINHPNIVKLLYVSETKTTFDLIMEYAKNGTLFEYVVKNKGLEEKIAFKFFIQVVNAIKFLHDNNVIHRDIKPENILLFENDVAKLSDFGWSIKCEDKLPGGSFSGTIEYMAPELINNLDYGKEIDIWMLGILLYELMHGFSPFRPKKSKFEDNEVVDNIMNHNISFYVPMTDECKELIFSLLEIDFHKRCTIDEIFNSKFVKNFEKEEFNISSFNKEDSGNMELNNNNNLTITNKEEKNTIQTSKSYLENRYNDSKEANDSKRMISKEKNNIKKDNKNNEKKNQFLNIKRIESDNLLNSKLNRSNIFNENKEIIEISLDVDYPFEDEDQPNAPKNNRKNKNKNTQKSIVKLKIKNNVNISSPIKKIEEGSPKNKISNSPKNNNKNKNIDKNLSISMNPKTILNNILLTSRRNYRKRHKEKEEKFGSSQNNSKIKKGIFNIENEKKDKKEITNYIFNNGEIDNKQKISQNKLVLNNNKLLSLSLSPGNGVFNSFINKTISPEKQLIITKDNPYFLNQESKFHFTVDLNENMTNNLNNSKDFPLDHLSSISSSDIRKPLFNNNLNKLIVNKENEQEKIVTKEKEPNDNMRRKNKRDKNITPQDNYNKNNLNKNIKPNDNYKKGGNLINFINIVNENNNLILKKDLSSINEDRDIINFIPIIEENKEIKFSNIAKNIPTRNYSVSNTNDFHKEKRKISENNIINPFKKSDNNTIINILNNSINDTLINKGNILNNSLITIASPSNIRLIKNHEKYFPLISTDNINNSYIKNDINNKFLEKSFNGNKIFKKKFIDNKNRGKKGKSVNKQIKDLKEFRFNNNYKKENKMKLIKVYKDNKDSNLKIDENSFENDKSNNKEIEKNNENKKTANNEYNEKETLENKNKEIKNFELKPNINDEIMVIENEENKDEEEEISGIKDNKKKEINIVDNIQNINEKEDQIDKAEENDIKKEKTIVKNIEKIENEKIEEKEIINEKNDKENLYEKEGINDEYKEKNELENLEQDEDIKKESQKKEKIDKKEELNDEKKNVNNLLKKDDINQESKNEENIEIKEDIKNENKEEYIIEKKEERNNENNMKEDIDEKEEIKNENKDNEIIDKKENQKENNKDNQNNEEINNEIKNEGDENNKNNIIINDLKINKVNKENIQNENNMINQDIKKIIEENEIKITSENSKIDDFILNKDSIGNYTENEIRQKKQTIPNKKNKFKKIVEIKSKNMNKGVIVNKIINSNKNTDNIKTIENIINNKEKIEDKQNDEKMENKNLKKLNKKNMTIKTLEIEKEEIKQPKDKIKKLFKTSQRKYSKEKRYTKVKINPFKKSDISHNQSIKINNSAKINNNNVIPKTISAKLFKNKEQIKNSSIYEYTTLKNKEENKENYSNDKKINELNTETKNSSYSKNQISNLKEKIKFFSIMSPEEISILNKSKSPKNKKQFIFKSKLDNKQFLFQNDDYDFNDIDKIRTLIKEKDQNEKIKIMNKNNTEINLNKNNEMENKDKNENKEEKIDKNSQNENKENFEINKDFSFDKNLESNNERITSTKNKEMLINSKKKYRKINTDEIKDENEQNEQSEKYNNDSESLIIDGDSEYGDNEIF